VSYATAQFQHCTYVFVKYTNSCELCDMFLYSTVTTVVVTAVLGLNINMRTVHLNILSLQAMKWHPQGYCKPCHHKNGLRRTTIEELNKTNGIPPGIR